MRRKIVCVRGGVEEAILFVDARNEDLVDQFKAWCASRGGLVAG